MGRDSKRRGGGGGLGWGLREGEGEWGSSLGGWIRECFGCWEMLGRASGSLQV